MSALHDAGVSNDESSAASESTGDEILALVGIVVAVTCLFAAWLWFGWQYAWIPTAVTGVWLIVLIGLSYSHLRDGDLRLKAKVVAELVLLLTPIAGVGAAGIWSPTGVNFSGSHADDTYTDDTYTDDIEIRDTERCKALEDAGDIAYNNGDVGTFGELGSEWAKECLD